jgi:glycolate oxidase FAD binding subunit
VTILVPRTANEVTDAVRWAASAGQALCVVAGGTRRGLGRPVDAPHVLDVSGLRGVLTYEPEELVLTALPGTPLDEIEALLASKGQCLAFEPPHLEALLAAERRAYGEPGADDAERHTGGAVRSTLGGAVATGLSGPRRPKAGAVRDHVLGIGAASGRGEFFMAGGKVVKNVTGYDIPKLITGSYGTLAVLTEVTIKVLPAPEDTRTLLVSGMTTADAVRAMSTVLQSTVDVSAACHLPAGIAAPNHSGECVVATESTTAFRLEGVTPSVTFRLARLRELLTANGSHAVLDREASVTFWNAVRDVAPFSSNAGDVAGTVWRISVPPARGAEVLARIEAELPSSRAYLDWGGALIWLQLSARTGMSTDLSSEVAAAEKIRAALSNEGHATLICAPEEVRRAVNVFHPQPPALAALSARVKAQFDPTRILNPGRMYAAV